LVAKRCIGIISFTHSKERSYIVVRSSIGLKTGYPLCNI
jgi:hypothetical protein